MVYSNFPEEALYVAQTHKLTVKEGRSQSYIEAHICLSHNIGQEAHSSQTKEVRFWFHHYF